MASEVQYAGVVGGVIMMVMFALCVSVNSCERSSHQTNRAIGEAKAKAFGECVKAGKAPLECKAALE